MLHTYRMPLKQKVITGVCFAVSGVLSLCLSVLLFYRGMLLGYDIRGWGSAFFLFQAVCLWTLVVMSFRRERGRNVR